MRVNLDQIEFYRGPSQPPSIGRRKSPPVHIPRTFQHFSPTEMIPASSQAPPEQGLPSTRTTYLSNTFDFEIDRIYSVTEHQMTKDIGTAVAPIIPATLDTRLDNGGSRLASSEPAPFKDSSAIPVSCPAVQLELDSLDVQENELPNSMPHSKAAETPRISYAPCVTAPTSKQADNVSSGLSTTGDSQQESASGNSLIIGASSKYISSVPCEEDTNSCHTPELSEVPCSRKIDAPGRAGSSSSTEAMSTAFSPFPRSFQCSSPEHSGARTTPISNGPVRYPSIAVVVPAPSWKQGRATRASTRAAAAACNKRLRSDQGGSNHKVPDASFLRTEGPSLKVKKRTLASRHLSHPLDLSFPASCHCTRDFHEIRGKALLTVASDSGLKTAYFFTFVPDTSSTVHQPPSTGISGKQRPYTSDENALLVRLKEREAMSWSEIADHFPDRNVSSLQVHYSTKLRHKAKS
ncbi:SANT/Myb-like DNA-binding domain-containing protein [Aspergillus ibericus CBS 121593]|uniref:Myb-like domain-containing protein n=1 Tax=Aspergillus ibericus CBS 121593 TaxID=1448316 RepID=A0A395GTH6_9EURO|nr:hypothetical protein BO80DRAFT_427084 [Aspergillus ibericus CBS 121593]RAK98702.1 hypothetical protein BO80DRAFT_427084 [Aspergillus ibericus CBS 121593]